MNTIERRDGILYIGTDAGLVLLDEANQKTLENDLTEEFSNVRIRHILKDQSNTLWFCTYGHGLVNYDGKELRTVGEDGTAIGDRVRTMMERENGELWVSSEKGIAVVKDGEISRTITVEDGLKNQINLCMLELSDGTVLVGSDGDGIAKIREDQISVIGTKDGLPSGVILRMVRDPQGDGVFVITSNSICYLDAEDKVTELDHFPYSNNYDMIAQGDTLFVLGSSGIYAVLRDELLKNDKDMNYTYLDSRAGLSDALVANSWTLHEEDRSRVYLAASTGVVMFDLAAYDERPTDFMVRVASIEVDGEKMALESGENFSFSKKVRRLEIRPEIINYSTVDPIIECYLEGFDREPIVMPQSELSTVVYTNLPADKYTFHMTLVDSESGVHLSNKVYYLESETAFTDTIWFYVLLGSLVILTATLIALVIARQVIREKERELEKSWKISNTDELTGLLNRFAMRSEFTTVLGKEVTITMLDIDYFKRFNDTYGHEMGDTVLRRVSQIIAKYYVKPDVAYRFGGDEFLLRDMTADTEAVIRKIKELAEEVRDLEIEGCYEEIGLSFGCASGQPMDKAALRELRIQADQKLYEAKKNRGNHGTGE